MIEKAVAFGQDRGLVGVWTEPESGTEDERTPAFILFNSGIVHHCGIWRLHVRVARALARKGVPSLRFDLSGIGDSNPPGDSLSLEDLGRRDAAAAVHYVRDVQGRSRIIPVGLCSGARDSIEAALLHEEVVGIVTIDLIARIQTWQHHATHFGSRLFRLESWRNTLTGKNRRLAAFIRNLVGRPADDRVSGNGGDATLGSRAPYSREDLDEIISSLLRRGTEFLLLYSNGVEVNYNHRSQFAEALPHLAAEPSVDVEFFPKADHTFQDPEQQAALIDRIVGWVESRFLS